MKMNSEPTTDKKCLGAVFRFIGVLLGLLVFIWLPPAEVKASGKISGVVRDSITKDPLPGVTITAANSGDFFGGPLIGSFSGSLTTESKGSPDEGVYSIDYPWCGFIFKFELDGYEPFIAIDPFEDACPSDIEWNLDIDMVQHVIPYSSEISSSMRLISPSGLIYNPSVFRWTPSDNPAVVSYRLIISGDPNVYFSTTGIDVIAPQAAGETSPDHDFWRVFGLDQFGDPVEQTQEIFEIWSTSQERNFTVISGLVKSDRNQTGLLGARVAVSGPHGQSADYLTETAFNGEYIVIAFIGDSGGTIPGPIEITATKVGFQPTKVIVPEGANRGDMLMRSITGIPDSPSLQLRSPPNGRQTNPVTVFRWTRSENSEVHSYRLLIGSDQNMENIIFDLPGVGDSKILSPQIAVRLNAKLEGARDFFWRVIALDESGNSVEQSQNIFRFFYLEDSSGFTVITGLVKSDLNQLGQSGARVAVSSTLHTGTLNNIVETEFNGEYIVIALTSDSNGDPIPFPIEITASKVGFQPTTVTLQESEKINGTIARDLVMKAGPDGDGNDGDGNGRATDPSLALPAILQLLLDE